MDPSDPAYLGQRGYGPVLLAIYDWWVLGFMAQVVLRSPKSLLVDRYRPLFGERHLDIGPGTGYFIDVAAPSGMELTLLDPNRHVLAHCANRLSRFSPTLVEADVLKPLPVRGPFDSVALSAVLHCLPGPNTGSRKRQQSGMPHPLSTLEVSCSGNGARNRRASLCTRPRVLKAANRQGDF